MSASPISACPSDRRLDADARPTPRPSAVNIGRKFERCFKGRDESNLNTHPPPAARYLALSTQMPPPSRHFRRRQQALTVIVATVSTIQESVVSNQASATRLETVRSDDR